MKSESEYEIGSLELTESLVGSDIYLRINWRPAGTRRWHHYNLAGEQVNAFAQLVNDATVSRAEIEGAET